MEWLCARTLRVCTVILPLRLAKNSTWCLSPILTPLPPWGPLGCMVQELVPLALQSCSGLTQIWQLFLYPQMWSRECFHVWTMPPKPTKAYKHCSSFFEVGGAICHYLSFIWDVLACCRPQGLQIFVLMWQDPETSLGLPPTLWSTWVALRSTVC